MRWLERDKLKALVDRAAQAGASVRPGVVHWAVCGPCAEPHRLEFGTRDRSFRVYVDLDVPCRRCVPCLKRRSYHWTARALIEQALAERTWFGTLTFRPEERARIIAEAHQAAVKRGEELPSEPGLFRCLAASAGPRVTRYLKRLRFEVSTSLRHMTVVEHHKDGFPHWHLLIHERSGPVRKEQLERQWPHGFSSWRLADTGAAAYVAKYLTKGTGGRVRASLGYGRIDTRPTA